MAQDRTAGYDMLVQVSEIELNTQVATAFLAGGMLPPTMTVPVNQGGVVGTATMNFGTPIIDLDRPPPQLGLAIPFTNSQFAVTQPVVTTLAPLGGMILIVHPLTVVTVGATQIVVLDFTTAAPTVTVAFDAATQALLAPFLAAAGMNNAQAQNLVAGAVTQQLQTAIRQINLSPAIPVVNDANPTTVFDIDVTTVNDPTAADRDCMAFGIRMANDSGGNVAGITTSFIPAGSNSLVMMSNFWLLARVMRPRVAAAIGRPVTDFDTPLRLNRNVPAPGGQGTLTALEARVIGNRIRVDGQARDSGTGWSAVSNFNFFIDIGFAGGSLTITATTPTVDTDVDLEWWVWLVSLGLGALFGGIVGAIVAAIVLAIVEAVAEGVVNGLVAGGIGGSLGGIPPVPLGPIGGGLTGVAVILDDLEFRGSIVRTVQVPIKSQGGTSSLSPFALDLDTGTIRTQAWPQADVIWDNRLGIGANGPAGFTVSGASFGSLTPVEVSRMPLATRSIPLSMIPFSLGLDIPFFPQDDVVFGARTSDGRYAKVRAYRSLTDAGALRLEWVTYDTAIPTLDIASRWSILERGEETEYITRDCRYCRSGPVRRCGVFEAWPRLMAFPVDLEWCLCGTILEEGEGHVDSDDGPIAYTLSGRRLLIETEMGQSIDCELCVSAIDARGLELFTCTQVSQPGIDTRCERCEPRLPIQFEVVMADDAPNGWHSLDIALERLAAGKGSALAGGHGRVS